MFGCDKLTDDEVSKNNNEITKKTKIHSSIENDVKIAEYEKKSLKLKLNALPMEKKITGLKSETKTSQRQWSLAGTVRSILIDSAVDGQTAAATVARALFCTHLISISHLSI